MGCHVLHLLGHKLHIGWLEKTKRQHWDLLPWKLVFLPLTFTLICLWHLSQLPISFLLDQTGIKHPCRWLYSHGKACEYEFFVSQKPDKFSFHSSLWTQLLTNYKNSKKLTAERLCIDFCLQVDHFKEFEPGDFDKHSINLCHRL